MILLFGSSGYIGSEFKRQLTELNLKFYCWPSAANTTLFHLNKWHKETVNPKIDVVINAAGYTGKPNVDACELAKEDTIHGNIVWPQILTDWCMLNDITLGHVSSGCIYAGRRLDGKAFTEEDEPNFSFKQNNCSFYSGTKALAEDVIRKITPHHYIWRLRIPFEENHNPRNYLSKMLNYKKLFNAENSISNKEDFVNACIDCIVNRVPYGTYNVTNTGYVTTKYVIEKMRKTIAKDKVFEFFDNDEDFYKITAKTPRSNCVLSNEKLLDVGIKIRNVEEALEYCLVNWKL